MGFALYLSGTDGNTVINTGVIEGQITLYGAINLVDTRQGTVFGKIVTSVGNDTIYGSLMNDDIEAGSGNDIIDGFGGADLMNGGTGDDIYYVDDAGDFVDETGGGTDSIFSFINYDLSDSGAHSGVIERLYLAGADDLDATGSNGAERIYGNVGNNIVEGGGGSDMIQGKAGRDTILGEAGQ